MATGVDDLGTMVLAAGALGTAAMGIVDGLKRWEWVDVAGYDEALSYVSAFLPAVQQAYGSRTDDILKAQYRDGRGGGELPKTLRQGLRIGLVALPEQAVRAMAGEVAVIQAEDLVAVAGALRETGDLTDAQRKVLAQFELAAHARIDAGMAIAEKIYVTWQKRVAAMIAAGIAFLAAVLLSLELNQLELSLWLKALIVGIAAVPLAPIAKDVSTALGEAARALRGR